MINVIEAAQAAECILVPKGEDNEACIQAFQEATDIEIPSFGDRQYVARSGGCDFFQVKGKDIPSFVSSDRFRADVGITGTDSLLEFTGVTSLNLAYQKIGKPMCKFALLAPKATAESVKWRLERGQSAMGVATSFPRLLSSIAAGGDLNMIPIDAVMSGSMEIMPELCKDATLVADLVAKGRTAKRNGLVVVQELLDIYPTIIVRDGELEELEDERTYCGIEAIDGTLRERYKQSKDPSRTSYAIEQMRDPVKYLEKIDEEAGELKRALSNESPERALDEMADLVIQAAIALIARTEGRFGIGDVIDMLTERNVRMSASGRNR